MISELVAQILAEMRKAISSYARDPRRADVPHHLRTLDRLLDRDWLTPEQREAVLRCRGEVAALLEGPEWRPGITLPPA
ncbi:hypothetical protein [Roseomonas chloroacetimidivorans]|uniref:hypothetical protein n=1 Tax=Roseomonas chloroacetimidivorans TaxID=1766656 RepID=UPI003C77FFED